MQTKRPLHWLGTGPTASRCGWITQVCRHRQASGYLAITNLRYRGVPTSRRRHHRFTPGDSITVTFTVPKAQFAVISHIKSAYLSVVSLLGRHGFRYGESKALAPVREQIAEPSKEIITHAACIVQSPDKLPDGIIMSRERRCWAVKIDSYVVLLPRGEDESFYEDIGDWLPDGKR